jgi:hypothetical protein
MRKMQKPNGLYFSLLTTIEISNNQVYILRDYVFSTLVLLKYTLSEKDSAVIRSSIRTMFHFLDMDLLIGLSEEIMGLENTFTVLVVVAYFQYKGI